MPKITFFFTSNKGSPIVHTNYLKNFEKDGFGNSKKIVHNRYAVQDKNQCENFLEIVNLLTVDLGLYQINLVQELIS